MNLRESLKEALRIAAGESSDGKAAVVGDGSNAHLAGLAELSAGCEIDVKRFLDGVYDTVMTDVAVSLFYLTDFKEHHLGRVTCPLASRETDL